MKGLELHRQFFEACGKPLLMRNFSEEYELIAVASVGFGSDRLGADDEYSRDHCWEPGFQIFSDRLPREVLKDIESFLFENLPWEFAGFERSDCQGSPNTIRAWTIDEFFSGITSFAHPPATDRQWLLIADEALYHVTNGEVFHDPTGDLTRRREIFGYFPDNVWRFKLAGRAMRIDVQRYQMERCIAHGEALATDLMLHEGLREVLHLICLVNQRYAPNDRWLPWLARRLLLLAPDIDPLISRIRATSDLPQRLSLFEEIEQKCADYCYGNGLAPQGQCWWADLRQAVAGELRDFPVPSWIGVEYAYSSQFGIGSDFRELLGTDD
ncbi:MAG: DUF4037 domain-containing protein [Armatimonadota bacterium]